MSSRWFLGFLLALAGCAAPAQTPLPDGYTLSKESVAGVSSLVFVYGYADNQRVCQQLAAQASRESSMIPRDYSCVRGFQRNTPR